MSTTHDRGFTLLEVLLSIAILAALGVLVLSSLTIGAKGFMAARADVETTQRARLALTRMAIDLRRVTTVTAAQPTSFSFTNADGAIVLAQAGSTITLNNNLLIENLASYPQGTNLFTYLRSDGATAWTAADDVEDLYRIVVTLRLNRVKDPVGSTVTEVFTATLNPRNTGAANFPD